MGKRMRNKVKTMDDLEKIYYGPNKDGRNVSASEISGYEDHIRTNVVSPMREDEVKQFFSPLGVVERISRTNQKKTSDFKIENEKLLIEVTSINTVAVGEQDEHGNIPINLSVNENEFIEKIDRKVGHAEEKKGHSEYNKIVVIYYDIVIAVLENNLIKKIFDPDFIRKTIFSSSSIDALIFLPPKASLLSSSDRYSRISIIEIPGPICYVKEQKMLDLLTEIKNLELKLLGD